MCSEVLKSEIYLVSTLPEAKGCGLGVVNGRQSWAFGESFDRSFPITHEFVWVGINCKP